MSRDQQVRISWLQEITDKDGKPVRSGTLSAHLLMSSGRVQCYERMELDANTKARKTWISTGEERERLEFLLGLPELSLTQEEQRLRIGVLRAPGQADLKLAREDAGLPTVHSRVVRLLDRWRPQIVSELRRFYLAIASCHLRVGKGDLLPILFPDVTGNEACATEFAFADPDPDRDRKFVIIEPELSQVLKRTAKMLNADSQPDGVHR